MKEKSILIVLVTLLIVLGTVLNSVVIQQRDSLSFMVENCSDAQDCSSDIDEIDHEELDDFLKDMYSPFADVQLFECFYDNGKSNNQIYRLFTPPPQVQI